MEKLIQVFCTVAAAALLADAAEKVKIKSGPVAFDKHDRCHICGMVILNYPEQKLRFL